ncbi:hypothetical protein P7C70_g8245, partial [Phenoliferia sp. Uapishka_3]
MEKFSFARDVTVVVVCFVLRTFCAQNHHFVLLRSFLINHLPPLSSLPALTSDRYADLIIHPRAHLTLLFVVVADVVFSCQLDLTSSPHRAQRTSRMSAMTGLPRQQPLSSRQPTSSKPAAPRPRAPATKPYSRPSSGSSSSSSNSSQARLTSQNFQPGRTSNHPSSSSSAFKAKGKSVPRPPPATQSSKVFKSIPPPIRTPTSSTGKARPPKATVPARAAKRISVAGPQD